MANYLFKGDWNKDTNHAGLDPIQALGKGDYMLFEGWRTVHTYYAPFATLDGSRVEFAAGFDEVTGTLQPQTFWAHGYAFKSAVTSSNNWLKISSLTFLGADKPIEMLGGTGNQIINDGKLDGYKLTIDLSGFLNQIYNTDGTIVSGRNVYGAADAEARGGTTTVRMSDHSNHLYNEYQATIREEAFDGTVTGQGRAVLIEGTNHYLNNTAGAIWSETGIAVEIVGSHNDILNQYSNGYTRSALHNAGIWGAVAAIKITGSSNVVAGVDGLISSDGDGILVDGEQNRFEIHDLTAANTGVIANGGLNSFDVAGTVTANVGFDLTVSAVSFDNFIVGTLSLDNKGTIKATDTAVRIDSHGYIINNQGLIEGKTALDLTGNGGRISGPGTIHGYERALNINGLHSIVSANSVVADQGTAIGVFGHWNSISVKTLTANNGWALVLEGSNNTVTFEREVLSKYGISLKGEGNTLKIEEGVLIEVTSQPTLGSEGGGLVGPSVRNEGNSWRFEHFGHIAGPTGVRLSGDNGFITSGSFASIKATASDGLTISGNFNNGDYSGSVVSEDANGVLIMGNDNSLSFGHVGAKSTGISILGARNKVSVWSIGENENSRPGRGISALGNNHEISVLNHVFGRASAIDVSGSKIKIENYGILETEGEQDSKTIFISSLANELDIYNDGHIKALPGHYAIYQNDYRVIPGEEMPSYAFGVHIANHEVIEGYIKLGSGNDRIEDYGAIINSYSSTTPQKEFDIDLGAGDDVYDQSRSEMLVDGATIGGQKGNDEIIGNDADNIFYGGDDEDTLQGGGGNDLLDGGSGRDKLQGEKGQDILSGGLGADTLIGGEGKDNFVFESAVNTADADNIDFIQGEDRIALSRSIFSKLDPDGNKKIESNELATILNIGDARPDSAHLIYVQSTGTLFYDADLTDSYLGDAIFKIVDAPTGITFSNLDVIVIS